MTRRLPWIAVPPPGFGIGDDVRTERWTPERKKAVVQAVEAGQLPLPKAMADYAMSIEEYVSWRDLLHQAGLLALRVTRLQLYKPRKVASRPMGFVKFGIATESIYKGDLVIFENGRVRKAPHQREDGVS